MTIKEEINHSRQGRVRSSSDGWRRWDYGGCKSRSRERGFQQSQGGRRRDWQNHPQRCCRGSCCGRDPTDNRDFRSDPIIIKNVVDDVKCFVDGRGFTELSFGDEGIDKVAVSEDKYIEFVNLGPIG